MQDIVERIFGRIKKGEFGEKPRKIIWSLNHNPSGEKLIHLIEAFSKALSSEFSEYSIEKCKKKSIGNQGFQDKCKLISISKIVLSERDYWCVKLKFRKKNLEDIFRQVSLDEKPVQTFVGRGNFWTEVLADSGYKVLKKTSDISLLNAIVSEYTVEN